MTPRRPHQNSGAYLKAADHRRLWVLVEGAVVDAFRCHPDYLTTKGEKAAVESITKRVVGQIVGHAKQTREGGRFGGSRGEAPSKRPSHALGLQRPAHGGCASYASPDLSEGGAE